MLSEGGSSVVTFVLCYYVGVLDLEKVSECLFVILSLRG